VFTHTVYKLTSEQCNIIVRFFSTICKHFGNMFSSWYGWHRFGKIDVSISHLQ